MSSSVNTIQNVIPDQAQDDFSRVNNLDIHDDHVSKICEELNVDPRCVGFCIGKHRVNLRRVGNEVYQKTGNTVYIKYVTPPGYEWGFFKIISRSQDGIEIAKIEIKKMEKEFLDLIRDGKMTPLRKKHIHEIKAWNPEYRQQRYKNFNRSLDCAYDKDVANSFTSDYSSVDRNFSDTNTFQYDSKYKHSIRGAPKETHEDFCWNIDNFESC